MDEKETTERELYIELANTYTTFDSKTIRECEDWQEG
jgi:hypothetical protein